MAIKQCPKCTYPMKKIWTGEYIITVCTNNKCLYSYKRKLPKEKRNG